eukprot:gb/GEZN01017944.1/.p1 GENE.gb/GEZN01017944.1/~~gb/GEZN01017944.1/.p1  ORF type:complete len:110 (-),score=19.48 gb/GEZN01017944.1/:378-707(-)
MADKKKGQTHTIVLAQFSSKHTSRHYSDYDDVGAAMDGICQMYEHKLKADFPNRKKITYDITDLYAFIDELTDLACLVYDDNTVSYRPHAKKWIKKQVLQHLKRQAGQA